jgi:OFA family oxalate/formate antiporter-like MFS transporter
VTSTGIIKADVPPPLDRAWRVLAGASLCMLCSQAPVMLFTFGLFLPIVTADTHWSPVVVASAMGPGIVLAALLAPLVGWAADRFGVRAMVLAGGPAYGLGLVLLGILPRTASGFMGGMALACVLGFAATPVLYAYLVAGWFQKRRGLALSIMFACTSIGVAMWAPIAARVMAVSDWRTAYVVIGLAVGSVISLSGLLLIRNPPAQRPESDATLIGVSMREALRTRTFWKVALAFFLLTAAMGGATVNLPIFLGHAQLGLHAGAVISVVGLGMFAGRLSAGVMLDRWFSPWVAAAFTVLPVFGFALLLADRSLLSFFIAAGLIGTGLGAEFDAAAYLVSRAFGMRAFGAIYGAVTLSYGLGSAIGPSVVSVALAKDFNPHGIFVVALGMLVAAVGLLLSIRARDLPFGGGRSATDIRSGPGRASVNA